MGKIITITSHKGGVGKTTTALNLGFSLSRFGEKVLLVDADPQGGIAAASNLKRRTSQGLISLLKGERRPEEVVIATKDKKMGVLGTGASEPEDAFLLEKEARKGTLGKIIRTLSDDYTYTFIDAPAGVGSIVTALLTISSSLIIPINCSALAVKTLPAMLKLIQRVRAKLNTNLLLEGVVLTMMDDRESNLEVFEELKTNFPPSIIFDTVIPFDDSFEIASINSVPVAMLPGGEDASQAYIDLAIELKTREIQKQKEEAKDGEIEGLF